MGTKRKLVFYVCFLMLAACPALGQGQPKKQMTEADYEKFGTLLLRKLSADGLWVSYEMQYANGRDTLFLQQTKSGKTAAFAKGQKGQFAGSRFAFLQKGVLRVRELHKNTEVRLDSIKQFELSGNGHFLLSLDHNNSLQLHNSKGQLITKVAGVTQFLMNDARTAVAYCAKQQEGYESGVVVFSEGRARIIPTKGVAVKRFCWQRGGNTLGFTDGGHVYAYTLADQKTRSLDVAASERDASAYVETAGRCTVTVADDGGKVFFSISRKAKSKTQEIEIWNGNDDVLYPRRAKFPTESSPRFAVWLPASGKLNILGDAQRSEAVLSGRHDYAVLHDPFSYGRLPKYPRDADFYIADVQTGEKRPFLKQQQVDGNRLVGSPLNNDLAYYYERNWWLYHPETGSRTCLSKGIASCWDTDCKPGRGQLDVFMAAGFTADGKSLLVHDKNDVWQLRLDGSGGRRLTNGAETQQVYRVARNTQDGIVKKGYETAQPLCFDTAAGLLLSVVSEADYSSGYAYYTDKGGIAAFGYGPHRTSGLKSNGKQSVYLEECFAQPPKLVYHTQNNSRIKALYASNPSQHHYQQGKAALIDYKNSRGISLKGVLYYPAGYDARQQYPMIVDIYEEQSQVLHHYEQPAIVSGVGLNVAHLTQQGYFVLLPDIAYVHGDPAVSALDCVTAAVQCVIDSGVVNPDAIGLMGHSFGGYETNYILAHSKLFAAGISGAGISDSAGMYFTLYENGATDDNMRTYESQQFRMGAPFFAMKDKYLANTPLFYADGIAAPLLLWSGKEDKVVPFKESTQLYMALRRLHRQVVLVAYPGEDHTLMRPDYRHDLSVRVSEWFDYFLKGERNKDWITNGTGKP